MATQEMDCFLPGLSHRDGSHHVLDSVAFWLSSSLIVAGLSLIAAIWAILLLFGSPASASMWLRGRPLTVQKSVGTGARGPGPRDITVACRVTNSGWGPVRILGCQMTCNGAPLARLPVEIDRRAWADLPFTIRTAVGSTEEQTAEIILFTNLPDQQELRFSLSTEGHLAVTRTQTLPPFPFSKPES